MKEETKETNILKNERAEVSVGIKKYKGIKSEKVLELLDEFSNFVKETKAKYGLDKFYLTIGNKIFEYKNYYDEENLQEINKQDIIKKSDDNMGIIKTQDGKILLIGKSEMGEQYKKILEKERLVTIFKNITGTEENIDISTKEDINMFKEIKSWLRKEENHYSIDNSYDYEKINLFLKEIMKTDYRINKRNENEKEEKNKIFKVVEKENIRVAFWYLNNGYCYYLIAIPEFEMYNYLDEGRFISKEYRKLRIFDFDVDKKDFDFFENNDNLREAIAFITKEQLQRIIGREKTKQLIEQKKENQEEELETKIKEELRTNKEVVLNGIKRTKDGFFHYQNQKIGYENYDVLSVDYKEKDFNAIFHNICFSVGNNDYAISLWVGNFKVDITRKGNYWYIEGRRINRSEKAEVLEKALCYLNSEDYRKFLREVSKCSIRIHNALSSGIVYNLRGKWNEEKIFSKVEIVRKKNRHYIKLNKNLFRIHNINKLFDMKNWEYRNRNTKTIAEVLEKETELKYNQAILVIKEGLKDYRISLKKAKELLDNTISKLGIKKIEVDNSELSEKEGYLVKSKSGKEYFITTNLKIYEYPKFRYICVIDKGKYGNLNRTDLLISRLYAIYNDTQTKELIYTL